MARESKPRSAAGTGTGTGTRSGGGSGASGSRATKTRATQVTDLKGLKSAKEADVKKPVKASAETSSTESAGSQLDAKGRAYATGKRKNSIARVWVKQGKGKIIVNGLDIEKYFVRPVLRMMINQPFQIADRSNQFDVMCTVSGGGLSGQAGALRHGISKALTGYEPGLRAVLKSMGFLTRDSRIVERKKYGRRKARRRFQFSKR